MAPQPSPPVYHIGTSGWSYDDWAGTFYPAKRPPRFDPLAYCRRYFNFVEINSTFYAVMPARNAERWARVVADRADFLFSLKLWQGLTHAPSADPPKKEVETIRDMCGVLAGAGRLGALLLQFPWSFRPGDAALSRLARLLDLFADFPCAVETRHSEWLRDDYIEFLRLRAVAFCNIDQPALRQCLRPSAVATAPFSYLRLHGRNAANWFRENAHVGERYDYHYGPDEIDDMASLARSLAEQTSHVMIAANNHFQGQAASNALMLRARLEGKIERAPSVLAEKYPALKELPVLQWDKQDAGRQTDLFE